MTTVSDPTFPESLTATAQACATSADPAQCRRLIKALVHRYAASLASVVLAAEVDLMRAETDAELAAQKAQGEAN